MKNKLVYGCIFGLILMNCGEVEDLLTFHVNDRTNIRIVTTDEALTQSVTVRADLKFRVTADTF